MRRILHSGRGERAAVLYDPVGQGYTLKAERNRTGSPYFEMDLSTEAAATAVGGYYIDLQKRHADWERNDAPHTPPELRFVQTAAELKLLEIFLQQNGRINTWDAHNDIAAQTPVVDTEAWVSACSSFAYGLNLEQRREP